MDRWLENLVLHEDLQMTKSQDLNPLNLGQ